MYQVNDKYQVNKHQLNNSCQTAVPYQVNKHQATKNTTSGYYTSAHISTSGHKVHQATFLRVFNCKSTRSELATKIEL